MTDTSTPAPLNDYERRVAERLARRRAYAAKVARESQSLLEQANRMASVIPMGQPILVGHYSEGRDRRYRAKIHRTFERAFQMRKYAEQVRGQIEAMENNRAIFSDNPRANELIQEKIERLEAQQVLMKEANKRVRKADRAGLAALGFDEAQIEKMLSGSRWDKGFPKWRLSNNGAEIRRLKQRLMSIERVQAIGDVDEQIGAVKLEASPSTNRVQLFFPGKPSDAYRTELKSNGFKWAPTFGAWQRRLSPGALELARRMAHRYAEMEN